MQDFTRNLCDQLPNQFHSKAVQVDGYLRVEGAPLGTMYAIGDASTVSCLLHATADARSTSV
jgi:NADH dehydrogenase